MAKRNDWELIEREYRTGRFSLAQLEARHGVNRSNISRRARKYGWEKDLTDRVRERTQQKIARASLPPEAQATLDDEVVEQAANENAAVVKDHRKTLERWRGITERFAVLLESQLAEGKIAVELPTGGTAEIDVPLEYVGKCLGHGTQALDRVIKMERQNYGLDASDKDEGVKSFEELMAEVAPSDLGPSERARQVKRAEAYLRAHAKGRLTDKADLLAALSLKWFRLNSLYKIKDKSGRKVRFKPNAAQRERYLSGHCLDLILKARQLGFTRFEMIDALDDCLFRDKFSAGCICHKLEDAQDIFRNKITFAYENIDDAWHALLKMLGSKIPKAISDKSGSGAYFFDNGSSIRVSTSYRGGTLQRLHVSEFGKICRQFPHKAKEIVTGAFEAVGIGNQITLESTAEGMSSTTAKQRSSSRKWAAR